MKNSPRISSSFSILKNFVCYVFHIILITFRVTFSVFVLNNICVLSLPIKMVNSILKAELEILLKDATESNATAQEIFNNPDAAERSKILQTKVRLTAHLSSFEKFRPPEGEADVYNFAVEILPLLIRLITIRPQSISYGGKCLRKYQLTVRFQFLHNHRVM